MLKTLVRDRLLVFYRKIKLKASRWFIFRKVVQYCSSLWHIFKANFGLRCGSVVECFVSMRKGLESFLSGEKRKHDLQKPKL